MAGRATFTPLEIVYIVLALARITYVGLDVVILPLGGGFPGSPGGDVW